MKNNFILNDDFNEIISLFENSNKNIFITGKAGTGKSSLINHIKKNYKAISKQMDQNKLPTNKDFIKEYENLIPNLH